MPRPFGKPGRDAPAHVSKQPLGLRPFIASSRYYQIGAGACGLAELPMAVADRIQVEVADLVKVVARSEVAPDATDDAFVGVRVHEELDVHQLAELRVVEHEDALHDDDVGRALSGAAQVRLKAPKIEGPRVVVVGPRMRSI